MGQTKALPTIFDIRDNIIASLEHGKYPETGSDYEKFFNLTKKFFEKNTTSSRNAVYAETKKIFQKRCPHGDIAVWNAIRTSMGVVHTTWMANKDTVIKNQLAFNQAQTKCRQEIIAGTGILDIFPEIYLREHYPNELAVITT